MGFEPTAFGLGSRHSTTELRPRFQRINIIPFAGAFSRGKLIVYCRYRRIPLVSVIKEIREQRWLKEVRLPKFGDTMEEGTIVDCKVSIGDRVKSGDVLFDVETDKATLEIESPADGFVKLILAEVGGSYRIETPLLVLGDKDEQVSDEFLRSIKGLNPLDPHSRKAQTR